ncbi:glycoside hydrolase family 3 N-terminal domain-containing protein [Flavobacterium aciduliphilum]|uniref:beta-N-acetylhexosaminidase n=1 Tax=Flavobacterium aciduliphilum TaxID=1101402 RepID=A0A328YQH8_9FLAO|nr:glycoside hydrolase family 3 N-terminal domain-containing protein [Flavobacterium aciduliphilum]RAR75393.1 beta-glucosidase-like glycosyl hydrolase [Flavobacterium aciduliphilum]
MKNCKTLSLLLILVLFTYCKSLTSPAISPGTIQKPEISYDDDEVYVPVVKSNRKQFFKDSQAETAWVDSIYTRMSFEEKIGQLFMVASYSNKDSVHFKEIDKLITENKIGGLIFFQGGPVRQAKLTNRFQSKAKVPLFIGIDAEWGLSMRLDSTYKYPWNTTLGAIRDLKLIEQVGANMAKEAKRIGAHFNFAPVLDINTNPKNPIIGNRSFGEDKVNVTEHAIAMMKGIQGQGVFCTGKHFPGHGDTALDSHYALPLVNFSKDRLEKVELYPYKRMFDEGLVSVMVAHLNVPSLEARENYPSSVSYNVVTDLLQGELGFDGLIFTDALNMKAASKFMKPGDIDLEAFLAGNDILLFAENVPLAYEKICEAYQNGLISNERIERSVKKILHYKYKIGLHHYKPIDLKNIYNDLNPTFNDALQYQLYEHATTVLKNNETLLPVKDLHKKIAYVKLGDDSNTSFVSTLKKYTEITEVTAPSIDSLNYKLKNFDLVIVGYHKSDKAWKKHDFSDIELQWLQEIAKNNVVILDAFAKPYSLSAIKNFDDIEAVVLSYQNSEISQIVGAELIFGAISSQGKLPVTINDQFKNGFGLFTDSLGRLGFTAPENVGMSPKILSNIDLIVKKAIDAKMTPGAQVLVARRGKVIFQKSYGNHSYDDSIKVQNSDIYDVASVTKMVSTLPNVMQQYDKGAFTLDSQLGSMLESFRGSNKETITMKELLSHYAKLQAWIPFYKSTLDADKCPLDKYYSFFPRTGFTKQVSENLYIRNYYQDSIIKQIVDSKLLEKKEYRYSDFTFIILKEYLEKLTGKSLDYLSSTHFYQSLGMNNTMYNPLSKFDKNSIPPTENDTYYRHSTIQGYVHDMAAAMQGGVGGHAGIFSNSMDLAKMMQMFLQKGDYGGVRYFSSSTFDAFNTCYYCSEGNRRGLGFDKPQLGKEGPTCGCVSKQSFGHTGFTGTMAWADPETEIVYIFLSNRTYPDSNAPNTLSKENIREDIQKIIQEAILDK